MRRATFVLLLVVTFALSLVKYNTIAVYWAKLKISGRGALLEWELEDENSGKYFDPLVKVPHDFKGLQQGPQEKRLYHVVVTADASKYQRWQCRILYYWYKKFKDHPDSEMGGFTRLLHSGTPDDVMDEIPTFIVNPLPPGEDRGYAAMSRPWAFVQWLQDATIEEEYIMMAEPDHIFIRPLPNLASEDMPAGHSFFGMKSMWNETVLRRFFPLEKGPITNILSIGNAPVIIKKSQLMKIAPTWHSTTMAMKGDQDAYVRLGLVLEMFAYATASALHGVKHVVREDFLLLPPWDHELQDKYIIHYRYGCDYTRGQLTFGTFGQWSFDKKSFIEDYPPRNISLPPPGVPETVVTLVKAVNEATANIPSWPKPSNRPQRIYQEERDCDLC